ncbi:methyltransferase domain-containing protein [bacterium]|nr:methyltransferase domain-containing protein [bacterium]
MVQWLRRLRNRLFPNWHAPNRMEYILRLAGECQSALDIGCGTGDVSAHLREQRPDARIVGLDFQRYGDDGLEHLDAFVEFDLARLLEGDAHLPFDDACFDTVLLTEVIEHLTQPHALLAEVHRVLAPEGALVLTCPNLLALENRLSLLLGTRWGLFPSQMAFGLPADVNFHRHGHVAHYTPFTLTRLLTAMGFAVETRLGFGFPIPLLRLLSRPMAKCLPRWAFHIGIRARRVETPAYRLAWEPCRRTGGSELILPGERCVDPQPHTGACQGCAYMHLNWLHPRDPRRKTVGQALADAGKTLPPERVRPLCW